MSDPLRLLITLPCCLLIGLVWSQLLFAQAENKFGEPNAVMGRAGTAGPSTLDSISLNPAHAGGIPNSEVQARWGFTSIDYSQRYPGFEAHSSKKQGLDPAVPIPSFVYKFTRRFGLAGIMIPFPVKQSISVKDLPIVILGQVNRIDLDGAGQLKAFVDLNLGYQANQNFMFGVNVYYLSIDGQGDLIPNGAADLGSIATFSVSTDTLAFGLGMKLTLDRFSIGLSTRAYEQIAQSSNFASDISATKNGDGNGSSHSTAVTIFNPIRLGFGYEYAYASGLVTDFSYRRAEKGAKRFSVVDFKEKELDVYDTLSIYGGVYHLVNPRTTALFGYFYEPSAIGPGTRGPDGKTGFGFMDLALNLGDPPIAPMWSLGFGAKYEFDRLPSSKKRRGPAYRMCIEGGLVYSEASIGVDESGEQPGAYLARRYMLPLRYSYRF